MNFTFFKDISTENKGGKYSSKKIWGHIIMALVGAAFVMDGLHWFVINEGLFNSMLIAGTTLLGLNTIRSFFAKKDKKDEETK
jgi:hypothetical protein